MENKENKRFWFRRKTYGYGWQPSTWQGWTVIAVYILGLLALFTYQVPKGRELSLDRVAIFGLLLLLLLWIVWVKGEKPLRWQWGVKSKGTPDKTYK